MGKAEDDPANDPVNPQPQASQKTKNEKSSKIADDPVYSQPQPPSHDKDEAPQDRGNDSIRSLSPATKAGEDISKTLPKDDPVYSQSQASSNSSENHESMTRSNTESEIQKQNTSTSKNASQRLHQISSHINPDQKEPTQQSRPKQRRRKSKKDDGLPSDYSDILNQIKEMQTIASTPDTNNRGYTRQKTSGKLWARERISLLLDPDTFREVGSITGSTQWLTSPSNPQLENIKSFVPTNNPQGFGRVTCPITGQHRQIYLTVDDFSIRSGHADGSNSLKTIHGENLALKLKVPVVKLVDGSSGGGSVTTIKTQGYSYIPHMYLLNIVVKQLNAGIPNLGAILGPAIGLGAARVVSTHFSVMAGDIGSLFNAGPKVVEGATFEEDLTFQDLGGPNVHCRNGTIDNLARDERDCFEQIKTVLGFLPDCGDLHAPPVLEPGWSGDDVNRTDEALRSIIPRKKGRMYNPRAIIQSVVDKTSFFEIGALWGTTAITGLARLGGRPVGILSNNCEVNSGALDTGGSQKLMKMLKFCDVFNLPILQFVDVPGYAIGTVAERQATMKWGVELAKAYYSTTTPIFSVMTRRCYGVAGGVMLDSRDPIMRVAWPSAEWGSLPLDGGIEVGHRHELNQIRKLDPEQGGGAEGWKRRYKELEDEYRRLMNPVRSANAFNIEEIVDPKDTRAICCRWAREMYGIVMEERLRDRATGKLRPVFT